MYLYIYTTICIFLSKMKCFHSLKEKKKKVTFLQEFSSKLGPSNLMPPFTLKPRSIIKVQGNVSRELPG